MTARNPQRSDGGRDAGGRAREEIRHLVVPGGGTVRVVELRGGDAGPTVVLLGGVHGDEPEGTVAIRRLLAGLRPGEVRGRVRAVAVAHPAAHNAGSRCSPRDGLNLARVFPGDAEGPPTSRLARLLTDEVIGGADLLVDLHSAGRGLAMPRFCGYVAGATAIGGRAATAARAFGGDLVWEHDSCGPGRSLSVAGALGIPALYVECEGGGAVRGTDVDAYVDGVRRVLRWMGVVPGGAPRGRRHLLVRGGAGDVDAGVVAPASGVLVTRTRVGARVPRGGVLAEVDGERGTPCAVVTAPEDGVVMLLRRAVRVGAGETVALVAPAARVVAPRPLEAWA